MKRSGDFLLRQVAGKYVLVPVGEAAVKFPGMITVNESGSYIWQLLESEQTMAALVDAITLRYEVDRAQAQLDVLVDAVDEILGLAAESFLSGDPNAVEAVEPLVLDARLVDRCNCRECDCDLCEVPSFVSGCFSLGGLAIRLEFVRTVCGINHPHTALGYFLNLVGAFSTHILVLRLTDFSVSRSQSRIDRSVAAYLVL